MFKVVCISARAVSTFTIGLDFDVPEGRHYLKCIDWVLNTNLKRKEWDLMGHSAGLIWGGQILKLLPLENVPYPKTSFNG